jgi:hypothetical protein
MKDVVGIEPVQKPQQPQPSPNPLKWNWTAIITWAVIGFIAFNIFKYLSNLL